MGVKIKNILAVIILVAAFLLGSIAGWMIKSGAKPQPAVGATKVTVNPSAKETKKADVAVKVQSSGVLSGTASLPKRTGSDREVVVHPERPAGVGLAAGESVVVPVAGTITAKYTDVKTGEQIGTDTWQLSGQTTVRVENNQVEVDTTFDDVVTLVIDTPEPKRLKNELGYCYDGDQKIYYKRNAFTLGKKIELSGYVGGTLNIDDVDESRFEAGVRLRW